MQANYTEIMEAINRIEVTLYGDDSRDKKGLVERINTQERFMEEVRDSFKKIIWLLVAGVAGAGLNLILNTRNMAHSLAAPPAQTHQPK